MKKKKQIGHKYRKKKINATNKRLVCIFEAMSKRYKLLKDLPDGQTSGTEYYLNGNSYYPLHINDSDKGFAVHRKWVENNPSWFKEIIDTPREWEILRVRHKITGLYRTKENFGAEWEPMVLDKIEAHEIVSVKRLYDGEAFSVKDCSQWGQIEGFELVDNKIKVLFRAKGDWQWLSSVKKIAEYPSSKEETKEVFTWDEVKGIIHSINEGAKGYDTRNYLREKFHDLLKSKQQPSKETKKERVQVHIQPDYFKDSDKLLRCSVEFDKRITADKLPLIKAAIEETLNEGWLLRYTQEEMDEAIMDAFKNARLIEVGMVNQILFDKRLVHKTVHDYIKSLTNKTPI